jgi:Ca2+-binding RTX toxin-like protein
MSKEAFILTIIGIAIIAAVLSTTVRTTSVFDGILSVLSPPSIAWALNVTGTEESDTLTGTNKSDNIRGHGEDDIISGLVGNDHIFGGMGDDTIHGDRGHDTIRGGEGDDLIFDDSGNDKLYGGPDDDSLTGGPGRDIFNCGDGDDTVIDFDPAKNETASANCENINTVTTIDEDFAVNIPSPNLPEEQVDDDIPINPFNLPLEEEDEEDNSDDDEEEVEVGEIAEE